MKPNKSLFKMTKEELLEIVIDTGWCLNCRKAISYNVLFSHFCLDCNLRYYEPIRKIKRLLNID